MYLVCIECYSLVSEFPPKRDRSIVPVLCPQCKEKGLWMKKSCSSPHAQAPDLVIDTLQAQ